MLRAFVDFVADLVHLGFLVGADRAVRDPIFPAVLESAWAHQTRARLAQLNVAANGQKAAPAALPAAAQAPGQAAQAQLPGPGAQQQKRGPGAPTKAEREAKALAAAASQAQ